MAFEGVKRRVEAVQKNGVVAFVVGIQKRFGEDGGGNLAASLTYFAFLSLFPLLLVAASVLGFALANDEAGQRELANRLAGSIPGLGETLSENVEALVDSRNAVGIVGVLGALWSGTALARASSFAFSRVYRKPENGDFIHTQLWAIGSTVGLGALALLATGVGAALPAIAFSDAAGALLGLLGIVAGFILDLALFTACYRFLNRSLPRPITRVWRGALIPAAGWTVLKFVGSWYAKQTTEGSTAIFGTLGSVVGILVILYLVSRLFIYGAELNAVLREREETGTQMKASGRAAA